MTLSRQEEIISGIWAIAAVLSFRFDYDVWGWIFAVKAVVDVICSISFAIAEIKKKQAKI